MSYSKTCRRALVAVGVLSVLTVPGTVLAQQADDAPILATPDGYAYDPGGRRDPFVNPIPAPTVEVTPAPDVRPPGLPGVLLNEATLSGVVNSVDGNSVVVVEAPGSRTFIAREGDELLDVVIMEIRSDSVVFEVKPLEGSSGPAGGERVVRNVAAPGE